MIPVARSHEAYLQFVVEQLDLKTGFSKMFLQQFYSNLILWITPQNLSSTALIMKDQYSPKTSGRKPHDPADLLRSLLLMNKLHVIQVDDWVVKLRIVPIYAILSGFPRFIGGYTTLKSYCRWYSPWLQAHALLENSFVSAAKRESGNVTASGNFPTPSKLGVG